MQRVSSMHLNLSVYLEPGRGDRLSSFLKQHIRKLLKVPILDSSSIKWVQPNTLVRFRGMIQDMLGNEFYAGAYKDKTNGLNVLLWSSRTVFWISLAKNREKRAGWMKQGLMAHLRCLGLFLGQTVRKRQHQGSVQQGGQQSLQH
ncbi:hypothetical protein Bca4012_040865 [Brassica carinata]